MEIRDWISIASAVIVALGWFVTGYLNRRKDVAQTRLEYRLQALHAVLPVWFRIQKNSAPFSDPEFLPLLEDARSKFQLYGLQQESVQMENFIIKLESQDLRGANVELGKLIPLALKSIRKELEIRG